ncbi:MAG: tetratricopeptide repeat protein [Candidatus Omnitrophica bacterium]|nr:tetratricopeptide repeat protein [Candidatus Omnitrophota bacterium]MBU2044512.1 tetratricopeptide repeat protein [Candidatus Omnitrophota bacterium]MBU2266016.1 tetratricopeptide repeat protein [Candidatus Omnitrophota bacterium]MBU2473403.1 tetratricopeptide repeat protein [Candidatus Omnitrophota bacterium]
MKKIFLQFIITALIFYPCYPETIKLKNGKTIDADIMETTDKYIKIDFHGVPLRYYVEDIESINGVIQRNETRETHSSQISYINSSFEEIDTENVHKLLENLGYPEYACLDIEKRLIPFLTKMNFPQLKIQAQKDKTNLISLKNFVAEIGSFIDEERQLSYPNIHPLLVSLVNGLCKEDIIDLIESSSLSRREKEEEKKSKFACSAITQLGSILLTMLGFDAMTALSPSHIFNYISFDGRQILFIDFTNQIFEIVNIEFYYDIGGSYIALKPEHRLNFDRVKEIRKQLETGEKTIGQMSQKELLNVEYSYLALTDSYSATAYIYNNLGFVYYSKGNLTQAILDYNQALNINPNLAAAYNNRGLAYHRQDQLDRAISDYNQVLKINPYDTFAYNNRGNAYCSKREFTRAISDYNQALNINQNLAEPHHNLGFIYAGKGDFTQAIVEYNRAINLNPNVPHAYFNRAVAYYHKGDYTQAWEDVQKAEHLGWQVNPEFLQELRRASGRDQ